MKEIKSESHASKKQRMKKILEILAGEYPAAKIQLEHENSFELLVATILSAQCTDARVNIVTEKLFKKYLCPEDYLSMPIEELERDIFSTGYYKAKAKHIRAASESVIKRFGGKVPDNMEDLLSLPGVGRKTANVILGHCFDTPGIVVDTHVMRITNRLGLADTSNPEKIERILGEVIPETQWVIFTHYFINLGRKICVRKPKCGECPIREFCPTGINN